MADEHSPRAEWSGEDSVDSHENEGPFAPYRYDTAFDDREVKQLGPSFSPNVGDEMCALGDPPEALAKAHAPPPSIRS